MAFMLVFGLLLVLQFVGMLFHRLSTFLHIAATTEVKRSSRLGLDDKGKPKDMSSSGAVLEWVKSMQKARGIFAYLCTVCFKGNEIT